MATSSRLSFIEYARLPENIRYRAQLLFMSTIGYTLSCMLIFVMFIDKGSNSVPCGIVGVLCLAASYCVHRKTSIIAMIVFLIGALLIALAIFITPPITYTKMLISVVNTVFWFYGVVLISLFRKKYKRKIADSTQKVIESSNNELDKKNDNVESKDESLASVACENNAKSSRLKKIFFGMSILGVIVAVIGIFTVMMLRLLGGSVTVLENMTCFVLLLFFSLLMNATKNIFISAAWTCFLLDSINNIELNSGIFSLV